MTKSPLPDCDCTVHCGDDPRLRTRAVNPCDTLRRQRLMVQRAERAMHLVRELCCEDELEALELALRLRDALNRIAERNSSDSPCQHLVNAARQALQP